MEKCLAFVLGGGGARGALQVGALRALFEVGLKPDLLVGTSIGAVNATGLAKWGINLDGVNALKQAYREVADSHLMDPRLARLAISIFSLHPNHHASRRIAEFFIEKGITPDLHFNQIRNVRLALIGADLDTGQTVIYGKDPEQSVLEGLMASIALPPWFAPVEKDGHCIVDGGALSNLPIEPALKLGATEIIALDLDDPRKMLGSANAQSQYMEKLVYSITQRQVSLEMELASARGVPVQYVSLRSSPPVPIWDFKSYRELISIGHETMQQRISGYFQNCQFNLEPVLMNLRGEKQPA